MVLETSTAMNSFEDVWMCIISRRLASPYTPVAHRALSLQRAGTRSMDLANRKHADAIREPGRLVCA